ncbi:M12 family metallo-peptidase [Dyadobacter sp. NIV53]|uniref:M12 family metallo-peptidase n=1 Tax=Dyadobacter sp. NIV53 TaxID=2861765 RepID=UPI001C86DA20|nr:M12 family metallo-peptidase [Dyadobacter sp. NIV53]
MKKNLQGLQFLLLNLIIHFDISGQIAPSCGTEKIDSLAAISQLYYDNNQILINKADSVEAGSCPTCRGIANEAFVIPVHVYIYRNNAGVGGITDERAERLINLMNTALANSSVQIKLYLKNEITRISNTTYYELINTAGQTASMFETNHDDNAISIHITRTNSANYAGKASFPWKSTRYNFAVITEAGNPSALIGDDQMVSTMVHELGHVLGLTHTHESARLSTASNNAGANDCYQESVSRTKTQAIGCFGTIGKKKCVINGDMISDTEADPELNRNIVTVGCAYSGTGSDNWGTAWTPPTRNYMSYTRWECRNTFSKMQRGIMYTFAQSYMTSFYPTRHYNQKPVSFYKNADVDFWENDNFFQNAQSILLNQQQYRAFHWKPGSTALDVDWVLFRPTSNIAVKFQTSAVTGKPQPNTRITLFADNGTTQLFQNDNTSSSTVFSAITTGVLTANVNYRLRIENLSAYPNNESKGHYNLDVSQPGIPVLNADITGPGFPLACERGEWFASATGGTGTYTYQWSIIENSVTVQVGIGSSFAMYNDETYNRNFSLQLVVTSGSQQKTVFKSISFAGCNSGALFVVSPNPASENIIVIPSEENKQLTSFQNANEFDASLYKESNSKMIWQGKSNNKEIKIDSRSLINGSYLININDGRRLIKKHVLIVH